MSDLGVRVRKLLGKTPSLNLAGPEKRLKYFKLLCDEIDRLEKHPCSVNLETMLEYVTSEIYFNKEELVILKKESEGAGYRAGEIKGELKVLAVVKSWLEGKGVSK